MSWVSSLLEKAGVSKETQRKAVNVVATVAAPVTGGLSTLFKTAVSTAKNQTQSVVQNTVQDIASRTQAATTVVRAADTAATAQSQLGQINPFLLVGASIGIALLLSRGGGGD